MKYLVLVRFFPRKFGLRIWFSYIKWRLETIGCYYPDGKFKWKIFYNEVIKRLPSYIRWIKTNDSFAKRN